MFASFLHKTRSSWFRKRIERVRNTYIVSMPMCSRGKKKGRQSLGDIVPRRGTVLTEVGQIETVHNTHNRGTIDKVRETQCTQMSPGVLPEGRPACFNAFIHFIWAFLSIASFCSFEGILRCECCSEFALSALIRIIRTLRVYIVLQTFIYTST